MKRVIAAAVLLFATAPALALGGYFGMGLGQSRARDLKNEVALPSGLSSSVDDTDTALSAFVGYEFSRNISGELGYVDFGTSNIRVLDPATGATARGNWQSHAVVVSAVGLLPIVDEFGAFGRAGIAMANVDLSASNGLGFTGGESGSSTKPVFGAGLQYGFSTRYLLRAEFDRYQDVGTDSTGKSDVDVVGASAAVRF